MKKILDEKSALCQYLIENANFSIPKEKHHHLNEMCLIIEDKENQLPSHSAEQIITWLEISLSKNLTNLTELIGNFIELKKIA